MKNSGVRSPSILLASLSVVALFLVFAPARLSYAQSTGGTPEPMTQLKGVVSPAASPADLTTSAPQTMVLQLRVYLALRNEQQAEQLDQELHDPNSPKYHEWLGDQQFEQLFGPTASNYSDVAAWLTSQAFTVTGTRTDRRDVEFTGTVAQADRAFDVRVLMSNDGARYGILSDPMIPARFQGVISNIAGLDNLSGASPAANVGGTTAFGPSDFGTFYNQTALLNSNVNGGGGDCLGIVGLSDYLAGAVSTFDTQFGLSAPNISEELADQTNPGITSAEGETLLDIEWGQAAAPGTALILYLGNTSPASQAILDATNLAVSDNKCGTINISFVLCGLSSATLDSFDSSFMTADISHGQSVFVSSGDFGAAAPVPSGGTCVAGTTLGVNEISADPHVTSVGGTQFSPNYTPVILGLGGADAGFVAESVWDVLTGNALGASGGGVSSFFTKPNYQVGLTPADGQRDVPDVALMAGALDASGVPNPGAFLGDDPNRTNSLCPGHNGPCIACCEGGTSLASVLWAGVSKLMAQMKSGRLGNLNPELYKLAGLRSSSNLITSGGIRDVTTGSNAFNGVNGWPAQPGYDQSTGFGTLDITTFVNLFVSGRDLILFGSDGKNDLFTAEAYDPKAGTITALGTATLDSQTTSGVAKLPNGKILIVGGLTCPSCSTYDLRAQIYDPVTKTTVYTSGNLPRGLEDVVAIPLYTGKTYVLGWHYNTSLFSYLYDPQSQSFSATAAVIGTGRSHGTALLSDGRVLIVGVGAAGYATTQIYDPIANTYTTPGPRTLSYYPELVLTLANGKVLITGSGYGGYWYPASELFDPTTNQFTPTGSMLATGCGFGCTPVTYLGVPLPNGKAMISADFAGSNPERVEFYDPATGSFSYGGTLTTYRNEALSSIITNGKVLIAGGLNASNVPLKSAELYDPVAGTFFRYNCHFEHGKVHRMGIPRTVSPKFQSASRSAARTACPAHEILARLGRRSARRPRVQNLTVFLRTLATGEGWAEKLGPRSRNENGLKGGRL